MINNVCYKSAAKLQKKMDIRKRTRVFPKIICTIEKNYVPLHPILEIVWKNR